MDKLVQSQIRTKYFALLVMVYVLIHMGFAVTHTEMHHDYFYFYNGFYVLLLLYFLLKKELPMWTVYIFVLSLNGYVMLEYSTNISYAFIIFLAYPIFLAAYYQLLPLIFVVIGITSIELVFIFTQLSDMFSKLLSRDDVELLLFFFFILISTTIMHTWVENKIMASIHSQNQLMKSQLLSKEGYLRLFFDTARDGIAVFDMENRLIDLNPAFEELYGYKRDELIGKEIHFIPPNHMEEGIKRSTRIRAGESIDYFQTQDMRKDGKLIDVQLTMSPIHDKKGDIIATSVISRDISDQKETEKLRLQTEKLQLAGEIAAGVAHEIRNPMTVISGFIQMMNQQQDSPSYRYTKLIESEIKRIEYIISEFLLLSKPTPPLDEKFFLRHVLNDVLTLFEHQLKARNITLYHKWNAHHMWLQGDGSHVKQVFINVIKNAIEAMDNSGELHLYSYSKNHSEYIIVIRDTGSGMAEEVIENIFKPFYTTKAEGTGLGMMICQKIMADVGGNIKVQSIPGKGTTFYLQFTKTTSTNSNSIQNESPM